MVIIDIFSLSTGGASVQELDTTVEKLEDSSNSDSDSSSGSSRFLFTISNLALINFRLFR